MTCFQVSNVLILLMVLRETPYSTARDVSVSIAPLILISLTLASVSLALNRASPFCALPFRAISFWLSSMVPKNK